MTSQLILLIGLLILSGFFSSTELAYVVANKIKIELRARKKNIPAQNTYFFVQNPQSFFSTILISNNIINIAFASISAVFLVNIFGFGDFTIIIISSTLLLLFGELIPKYIAHETADSLIVIASVPLRIVYILLFPLVKITALFSDILTRDNRLSEQKINYLFEREDLQELITESSEAGTVGEKESDILNKIIKLREQKVYETMTPRTEVVGVELNSTIEEVVNTFIESGYSKIPVYEENLDNIKGILLAYDMFKSPGKLADVLRDVVFVPETKKSLELLYELLEKHVSLAIVVDEFGGTAGLVTVEDIIEELFGEIRDEYDEEVDVCKKIDAVTFILGGKVEIDYINEQFNLSIPEGDYETVGGYITSSSGKIPQRGEVLEIDHFRIIILHSDKTKVNIVKLIIKTEEMPLEY